MYETLKKDAHYKVNLNVVNKSCKNVLYI